MKIVTKLSLNCIDLVNKKNCILGRMETNNSKNPLHVLFVRPNEELKEITICLS